MPAEVLDQPKTETFADFHKNFDQTTGSVAQPTDVTVQVDDPTETGTAPSATDGASPTSEPAPATDPDNQEQGRFGKRIHEKQRRIDELTRQEKDLQERVAALTAKVPEKTGAPTPTATAPAEFDGTDPKDPAPAFPNQADPKYQGANAWELFEQDKLNWAVEKAKWDLRKDGRLETHKATVEQQKKSAEAQQAQHKVALDQFEARGSEFAEEHQDYPELVDKFKKQPISNETAAVIVNAANGPGILYHLMQNPDELKRIEALPTIIARLDAMYELKFKLAAPPVEKQPDPAPRRSKAPAAGTVLRGGGNAQPITIDNAPNFTSFKTAFDKSQGLR